MPKFGDVASDAAAGSWRDVDVGAPPPDNGAVLDWQDIDGRWYRVVGGSEGAPRAIVEISDLKQAEAALRENQQRFRDFAAASTEAAAAMRRSEASLAKAQRIARLGNWDLRVRSNEMSWSNEIYRIFGLANDAAPATYDLFLDMVHPDDRAPVETAIKAALYTGARYAIEHRIVRPDGAERFVIQEGEVAFDDLEVPLDMIGTVKDITDSKATEQRISEVEERFRVAFETAADALSVIRLRDGLYVDVNDAFALAFGYRKEEVIGRTVREIDIWSDPGQPAEVSRRLTSESLIRNLVLQQRRKDGERRTTLLSASLCTLGGEPHILASIKDITELKRAEVDLRKLWRAVEQSSTAVVITNAAGHIEYVNSCFTAVTGYVREEVVGRPPSLLKSGLTSEAEYRGMWSTIRQGDDWQGEFCNRRKDGSLYWATVTISPVKTPDGTISHFIGMQTDITQRKQAEQELRASEERFRSLVETSLLGISIEQNGNPLFVNRTFATIFGYDEPEEVLALCSLDPLYALQPPPGAAAAAGLLPPPSRAASGHAKDKPLGHAPGFAASGLEALGPVSAGKTPAQREVRGIRKDGSVIWLDAQTRMIPWNGAVAVQTSVVDITLRKRYEEDLHYQANYDAVTDLPNRSLALDRLNSAIASARRRDTRVAVLFIDVDHFKKINDTLGHAAGDDFLRQVAQRIRQAVREQDTVARLGGDEFLVVLPDVRLRLDTEAIAEKIVAAVSQPFRLDQQETIVTVSIGACAFPDDADDADTLMRHADAAMYFAKRSGRGAVRFFSPDPRKRNRNRNRMSLEVELRRALEREQLALAYQPLIDIRSNDIMGAEALLRWTSTEHGEIPPQQFVRLAEETGLIMPIGEWVLTSACREARRWHEAGFGQMFLSVNVSSQQLRGTALMACVRQALNACHLAPDGLELEIAESLLIDNAADMKSTFRSLKTCGVRLAVDNFGTSYASFGSLERLAFDTLKIDRSFVDGLQTDRERAALVDALIVMAHRLNLRVVAGGVESLDQLQFLRSRACDLAQGYYFSRPVPPDAFLDLLGTWPNRLAAG